MIIVNDFKISCLVTVIIFNVSIRKMQAEGGRSNDEKDS